MKPLSTNQKVKNITLENKSINAETIAFQTIPKSIQSLLGPLSTDEIILHIYGLLHSLPYRVKTESPQVIYKEIETILQQLQQLREQLSENEEKELKENFQKMILQLTLEAPTCKHFLQKPLGYAGDHQAMEIIWHGRNHLPEQFQGDSLLGKHINAFTLNMANCIANEYRVHRLKQLILDTNLHSIASIGCGPILEIEEALKDGMDQTKRIALFDQDPQALAICKQKLMSYPLNVEYHKGNIFKSIFKLKRSFDCIYSSGLFDYLNTASAEKLALRLWDCVNPNGTLVITNAQPKNPTRIWMEYITDWHLIYKDDQDMLNMCKNFTNIKNTKLESDNLVYNYLIIKKC